MSTHARFTDVAALTARGKPTPDVVGVGDARTLSTLPPPSLTSFEAAREIGRERGRATETVAAQTRAAAPEPLA